MTSVTDGTDKARQEANRCLLNDSATTSRLRPIAGGIAAGRAVHQSHDRELDAEGPQTRPLVILNGCIRMLLPTHGSHAWPLPPDLEWTVS